jgi:hypothetical protein
MPSFEAFAGGGRIVVHAGTPASKILDGQVGVFSCDMENFEKSLSMIKSLLATNDEIDSQKRLEFIKDKKLLWENFARKYADLIREQSWY